VSRASVRTFILTLDSVQHLSTLDQGTKRNVFQFSFVPYLKWEFFPRTSSDSFSTIVPETVLTPPTLPAFYPHSDGPLVGPVHIGVRSKAQVHHNDDGPGLVGRCHLTGDL
jgi:hypothetical protein